MIPQTDTVPESHLTDAADTFRSRFSHLRKAPAAASIGSSGLSYARPRHIKCDESRLINKSLSWQLISSHSRATQRASWAKPAQRAKQFGDAFGSVRQAPMSMYMYTHNFFFSSVFLFLPPRNLCMYECRYCSIKAELPCRRLHTPAGAGPQKVVPVTRCTLVTAGKARGEGWQITMRASCQVARILIRLEGTWEEKRQTL